MLLVLFLSIWFFITHCVIFIFQANHRQSPFMRQVLKEENVYFSPYFKITFKVNPLKLLLSTS